MIPVGYAISVVIVFGLVGLFLFALFWARLRRPALRDNATVETVFAPVLERTRAASAGRSRQAWEVANHKPNTRHRRDGVVNPPYEPVTDLAAQAAVTSIFAEAFMTSLPPVSDVPAGPVVGTARVEQDALDQVEAMRAVLTGEVPSDGRDLDSTGYLSRAVQP